MEKFTRKIEELTTIVDLLTEEKTSLNAHISGLQKEIAIHEAKITEITDEQNVEANNCTMKDADLTEAVEAIVHAITALKESKGTLVRKVKLAMASFKQLQAASTISSNQHHMIPSGQEDAAKAADESFRKVLGPSSELLYSWAHPLTFTCC